MESKTQQQKNKSNDNRPYTIRLYINRDRPTFLRHYQESKTNQELTLYHHDDNSLFDDAPLFDLVEKIKKDDPKVVEIQLLAHGKRDGKIKVYGNDEDDYNLFFAIGRLIKKLLNNGVKRVYIKTAPCHGGMFCEFCNSMKSIFQIIKSAIQEDTPKKNAEELINKVYCSTTRAGIGGWYLARMNNHSTGYCRDKTIPWYQKLRYRINDFFRTPHWAYWQFGGDIKNWFANMSRSKQKAMGSLIGSEGKIYFPLRDADKFGYENYFKNPDNAKKLHKKYSGPNAKERAYYFLGFGYIGPNANNAEVKANLNDTNIWKSYYTSGWSL